MIGIRTWIYRVGVTSLFILALLTTYFDVTGVSAKDILELIKHENALLMKKNIIESKDVRFENEIDLSVYPTKKVVATGYTAGIESTGKTSSHPEFGITYSGVKVKRDYYSTIAADLDYYPIGTIFYIPGYGFGVVADKGGGIKGQHLDLYYETVEDVYNLWGKKTLDVFLVKRGDGTLTEHELAKLNENKTIQVFRQKVE